MSELTLQQLLTFDVAPFAEAVLAWRGLAQGLDDAAEVFIRGTKQLPDAWPEGTDAAAAQYRAATLSAELSGAYRPARQISAAVQQLADGMAQLRDTAQTIVAEARAAGLDVDVAIGEVSAPLDMYRSGSPAHAASLVNRYIAELTSVVERARGLDDMTARVIAENLPDPVLGFGTAAQPPLSRQELVERLDDGPFAVRFWWDSLTPARQEQAIADYPELIGWLDGIPSTDRDSANRLRLDRDLADLQARADELHRRIDQIQPSRWMREELARLQADLGQVNAGLDRLNKVEVTLAKLGEQGMLLGYDPAGDGRAIVAVGNPDNARHTAVWVPGLGSDLSGVGSDTERVQNLQREANKLTRGAGDVAGVMWLGYDAPEKNLTVLGNVRSKEGGQALDSFVDGLNASHAGGGEQHVTAVGHSYGSTVVAEAALTGSGLAVEDIVVAGSPGMHTDHAASLHIDPRHVWAGSAVDDPVSDASAHSVVTAVEAAGGPLGGVAASAAWQAEQLHGDSPHRPEFGANQFHVDTTGHSDYWKKDTVSLRNQAFIVVCQYDGVTLDRGSPPS